MIVHFLAAVICATLKTLIELQAFRIMTGATREFTVMQLQSNFLTYLAIGGFIYANVWNTNWIMKIDPASGKVVGRVDLSRIGAEIKAMYPDADVLNGIAYDANSKALLVTGKLWPKAYLIRLQ